MSPEEMENAKEKEYQNFIERISEPTEPIKLSSDEVKKLRQEGYKV